MIQIVHIDEASTFVHRRSTETTDYESVVRPIIEAVRQEGDAAVLRYARQLDGLQDQPLRISREELQCAASALDPEVLRAAQVAIANIRQFAKAQLPQEKFEEFSP